MKPENCQISKIKSKMLRNMEKYEILHQEIIWPIFKDSVVHGVQQNVSEYLPRGMKLNFVTIRSRGYQMPLKYSTASIISYRLRTHCGFKNSKIFDKCAR